MNVGRFEGRDRFFQANNNASLEGCFGDDVEKPVGFVRFLTHIDDDDLEGLSFQLGQSSVEGCGFCDFGSSVDEQQGRCFPHEFVLVEKQDVRYVHHDESACCSERAEASSASLLSAGTHTPTCKVLIFQAF